MKLSTFTKQDFDTLYDFMRPIWLETYAFLPSAQIELLLEKYFSASALERFQNQSYQYRKIDGDGVLVYVEKDEEIYIVWFLYLILIIMRDALVYRRVSI
jgi:hypothetical protein